MMPEVKLFVGLPCSAGQMFYTTAKSLLELSAACESLNWQFSVYFLANESLVQRGRNRIVSNFMATDFTHLLFIDSDIGFNASDIVTMIAIDQDMVVAPYPKKEIIWESVHSAVKHGVSAKDLPSYGACYVINFDERTKREGFYEIHKANNQVFVEVMDAGTGCMLIKRHVIQRMMDAYPELEYKADVDELYANQKPFALFDCMIEPETRRYLSEDYLFCRRWQNLGGKVYCNMSAKLTHTGTNTWSGDAEQVFGLKEPDYSDLPVQLVEVDLP